VASIHHEATIDVSAGEAWARLRRVDQAHVLFAPVLVDGTFDRDLVEAGSRALKANLEAH